MTARAPAIKRQRKQVQRFEVNDAATPSSSKKRPRSEAKDPIYNKGTFLAIRAEGGKFFYNEVELCTLKNQGYISWPFVFTNLRNFH